MEKYLKKDIYIYVCITESLCCTPETITTIKKKLTQSVNKPTRKIIIKLLKNTGKSLCGFGIGKDFIATICKSSYVREKKPDKTSL